MALYLQLDGVDDYASSNFKIPVDFIIEVDFVSNNLSAERVLVSQYNSDTGRFLFNTQSDGRLRVFLGGLSSFTSTNPLTVGTRYKVKLVMQNKIASLYINDVLDKQFTFTGTITQNTTLWLGRINNGGSYFNGRLHSVKISNLALQTLLYYDMTTSTVQDQSGNGNHATLYGGTWLDDGTGGTPTGTDGSSVFSFSQKFYSDENLTYSSSQKLYSDEVGSYVSNQFIYQDGYENFDSKQSIYEDTFTPFGTQQEIFNDGQIGSINYPLLLQVYMHEELNISTQQSMYEIVLNQYYTTQSMYENNQIYNPTKQIIYSDSLAQYDTTQKIYSDISSGYITKQSIYDNNSFTLNTLQQLFEHSSMDLQTKQSIYQLDTVELLTVQSIYEDNSMSMDTLQQFLSDYVEYRQVFKYLLSINRQSNFDLGIVGNQKFGVDISDRVIKYDLNVSDQVKKYDLNI